MDPLVAFAAGWMCATLVAVLVVGLDERKRMR